MEETTGLASEDTSMDNFLVFQFSALMSHIDGLFNSGAQRINAYLVPIHRKFTRFSIGRTILSS
ncbi:MAG: hypothetical protein ABR985_19150 [Methanotrichaceae archaeon]|jgi:hypothetical protein